VLAYAAAELLAFVPFTPGGLGFVEAGLVGALTLAGVPAHDALTATLLYRLAAYWLPLPAGGIAYVLFRRRYGDLRDSRQRTAFSQLKSAAPALAHPSKWHGVVTLTLDEFTYAFVNTFSPEHAQAAYETYAVPETGEAIFEGATASFHLHPPTEVHFKMADRAPLLIIGASEDHTVPASVSRAQFKKYEKSDAQTEYAEFAGRPHLMMVAEGWEEIATKIDNWIHGVLTPTPILEGQSINEGP
jgi:hypothetical protein